MREHGFSLAVVRGFMDVRGWLQTPPQAGRAAALIAPLIVLGRFESNTFIYFRF